jgi:hypothetical protein
MKTFAKLVAVSLFAIVPFDGVALDRYMQKAR